MGEHIESTELSDPHKPQIDIRELGTEELKLVTGGMFASAQSYAAAYAALTNGGKQPNGAGGLQPVGGWDLKPNHWV